MNVRVRLLLLVGALWVASTPWLASAYVNEAIPDASIYSYFEEAGWASGVNLPLTKAIDPAGGVRYTATLTSAAGEKKLPIADKNPIAGAPAYGFPVSGGAADWSGYTWYMLEFTNHRTTDWVMATAYFLNASWVWQQASNIWLKPGETRVCACYLPATGSLTGINSFGLQLFVNEYGSGEYKATAFDVTVRAQSIPHVPPEVWANANWAGSALGRRIEYSGGDHLFGYDAFATIQDAIDAVEEGGTVWCEAGTSDFVEDLVITKDGLDIRGVEGTRAKPVLKGVATDPWINWPLAHPNIDLQADGVKLHGFQIESPDVPDGYYSSGICLSGTDIEIYDNDFVSIGAAGSDPGACVVIQTYRDNVPGYDSDISGLDIHDNDFSGTPAGGYVGVFINHTEVGTGLVRVRDNTMTGTPFQGIWTERSSVEIVRNALKHDSAPTGYGVVIQDYGCREESAVRVHRNTIEGFNYGLLVGRVCGGTEQELSDIEVHDNYFASNGGGGGGGAVWVRASGGGVAIHYNGFSGNYCGVKNTAAAQVDARYNWWGDPSGPTVPGRGGDPIEGDVLYDPFYTANLVCVPDPMKLNLSAPDGTVTVKYLGGGSHPIFGYSVTFAWDGDVVSTTSDDVDEGPFMAETCDTYFAVNAPGPAHTLVVDCAMLCDDGDIAGVAFPGDLFSIDFSAEGSGTSPVDLEIVSLVTRERNGVTGVSEDDGEIQVDVEAPTVSSVHIANLTLIHTDDYVKDGDDLEVTAVVTDDEGVDKEDILADLSVLLDGGGTAVEPDSYDGTVATWTVPLADVTLAADGTRLVTVNATDRLGNPAAADSDGIIVDNTPPTSPSDFAAAPGHQKVQLGWTNGSDDHYAGVKIVYNRWGAYPEYGSNNGSPRPSPDYPTAHSDPDVAFADAGTSHTWSQTDRDIYFFSAFSYDEARNYCAIPDTASATNYWLGDVNGDGAVGTGDISVLASSYYQPEGGGTWDNRCDVGPTHNGSRLGLPYPDDQVQFEDLMIFAMNFGVVAPQALPPVGVPPTETAGAVAVRLELPASVAPGAELSVPVYLEDARGVVQGVHFAVGYDAHTLQYLGAQPGALVQGCEESFFMPVVHEGLPVVDAAALGDGATFGRSGELAVLRFRCTGEGSLALRLEEVSARNVLNEDLFAETSDVVAGPEARIPAEVFLSANRPNPAQGGTGIVFGLPSEGTVRLAVYDVSGRAVRTLVSGSLAAGEHAIVWDGRDEGGRAVSGGVYLYRLETQGRTITRKMVVTE